MVEKYQRDLSETQAALYEEGQTRSKLQMELDSKDSEIELLQQKLSVLNLDTASIHSGSLEDNDSLLHNSSISGRRIHIHPNDCTMHVTFFQNALFSFKSDQVLHCLLTECVFKICMSFFSYYPKTLKFEMDWSN